MTEFFINLYDITLEASPWLLFGLVAAGLLKSWVTEETMKKWLGGQGTWAVTRAALVGAPLPLCSCGVLPAALGLRRAGASRAATTSFLIATPETGVDSIAVSFALLGPFMTIVRPVAAIIGAIFSGLAVGLLPDEPADRQKTGQPASSCCASDCCDQSETGPENHYGKIISGIRHALSDIWDDIVIWLVIGLVLAAGILTILPPMALAEWGSGLLAMLLMLLIGIPMYICATASTPLAAGLLLAGISPGTVLVFLLAGPATNISTVMVVSREMGKSTALVYLAGIAVSSIAIGLLVDWIVAVYNIDTAAQLAKTTDFIPVWVAQISAVILIFSAIKPLRRRLLGQ